MLLDDHLVKLQAMAASPFGKAFEGDIQPWSSLLKRLQDTLEQWLMCQVSRTEARCSPAVMWLASEQAAVLLACSLSELGGVASQQPSLQQRPCAQPAAQQLC